MSRLPLYASLLCVAALLGSPRAASAQVAAAYADPQAFAAAGGTGLPCLDFQELTDGQLFQSVTYPGVSFHSTDGDPQDLLVVSPDSFSFPALQSRVLLSQRNFNPLVMEFAPAVSAVSFDALVLPTGAGVVVTVEGTGGVQTFAVPLADGGPIFIGLVSSTGSISRVTVANLDGETEFVGVDNVCYGQRALPESPVQQCLDRLQAALKQGRADGTIQGLGTSLEDKATSIRAAVDAGDLAGAAAGLGALRKQVQAQSGKHISRSKAAQLVRLIDDCLRSLSDLALD